MKVTRLFILSILLSACDSTNSPQSLDSEYEEVSTTSSYILTFDDGPHPKTTLSIIESLKQYKIQNAIFFLRGDRILLYPELVIQIYNSGYTIGYHSMYHDNLVEMSVDEISKDIKLFNYILNETLRIEYPLTHARPPYGGMSETTYKRFKYLEDTNQLHTQLLDINFNQSLIASHVLQSFNSQQLTPMLWNVSFKDWEQPIQVSIAKNLYIANIPQIWLFHERPEYKGIEFDNKIDKQLPEILQFLTTH